MALVFMYGSNMSQKRLKERIGSIKKIANARLNDYNLAFTKYSTQLKCGVIDVVPKRGTDVRGVLFEISDEQFAKLNGAEKGYGVSQKMVKKDDGGYVPAYVYEVKRKAHIPIPTKREYADLIIEGAIENNFDSVYIKNLQNIIETNLKPHSEIEIEVFQIPTSLEGKPTDRIYLSNAARAALGVEVGDKVKVGENSFEVHTAPKELASTDSEFVSDDPVFASLDKPGRDVLRLCIPTRIRNTEKFSKVYGPVKIKKIISA